MKERGILFRGEMVKAILEGRKTQTRRVVPQQPTQRGMCSDGREYDEAPYWTWRPRNNKGKCLGTTEAILKKTMLEVCPYGKPGDRLWVKETWRAYHETDTGFTAVQFKAGGFEEDSRAKEYLNGQDNWRPSIHLPRWASRITLEITAIRVERACDISAKDIIAEGAVNRAHEHEHLGKMPVSQFDGKAYPDLKSLWHSGFTSINGPDSSQKWVWVIEFKRV